MGICAVKAPAQVAEEAIVANAKKFVTSKADGELGTFEYRLRFRDGAGNEVSPWHDIPLRTDEAGFFNMVVEIPKMTKRKMEVNTKEAHNPIAQDIKKGKLRDYHGPMYWNYGMFPQTWEDPGHEHLELKVFGDNDPLDAVEIGSTVLDLGSIVQVKVLGALAMIDDGELDWKVICIRKGDPLAEQLDSISDVEVRCPGVVSGVREWLRWYKTPDEKPLNTFGFREAALEHEKALEVVAETHEFWRNLCDGKTKGEKLWTPRCADCADDALMGA